MNGSAFPTLPDYLREGLDIVFVGINPGAYSASVGKYFATPQNRFWTALNRSGLVDVDRALVPGDEAWLNDYGIGFTDVVKRASASASNLKAADLRQWAPLLKAKLLQYAPLIVCFNGLMGFRWYMQYAEETKVSPRLGGQEHLIGASRVFIAPNPSPANASFSLDIIAGWYGRLGEMRATLKTAPSGI
ncbi:MAG: mismatch-specific DNA-glycosylase [Dehalococcoidia bacterium]